MRDATWRRSRWSRRGAAGRETRARVSARAGESRASQRAPRSEATPPGRVAPRRRARARASEEIKP